MAESRRCSGGGKHVRWRYDSDTDTLVPLCSSCGLVVEVARNGGAKSHPAPTQICDSP